MPAAEPRRSLDKRARLGHDTYDRLVRPHLRPEHDGLFVALDIDTGDYEIDEKDHQAFTRLGTRNPGAEMWLMMAGRATAYRFAGSR